MNIPSTAAMPDINKLWDYNNPAATEQKFRKLLPEAIEQGNISYQGQLLTQIARTYSLRKMFDEAHRTLKEVEQLPLVYPVVQVRYLLEKGRAYNSAGKKEEAKEQFLQAWKLAKREELDYYAVDAAHMMAIAETEPILQIQWNDTAIRYAETAIDPSAMQWLGSLYNNLGWTYHDQGNFVKALNLFERAWVYRTINKSPIANILIAKWCVARANRSLGNIDEALMMQQQLVADYDERELPQDAYVYEELALLNTLKGNQPAAQQAAKIAYDLLSKDTHFIEKEHERWEQLRGLAGR